MEETMTDQLAESPLHPPNNEHHESSNSPQTAENLPKWLKLPENIVPVFFYTVLYLDY